MCIYHIKYSTTNLVWSRGSNARRQWAARFGQTNCANNESSLSLDIYTPKRDYYIRYIVFCAAKTRRKQHLHLNRTPPLAAPGEGISGIYKMTNFIFLEWCATIGGAGLRRCSLIVYGIYLSRVFVRCQSCDQIFTTLRKYGVCVCVMCVVAKRYVGCLGWMSIASDERHFGKIIKIHRRLR